MQLEHQAAMDGAVIPRVELYLKSVNASSGKDPGSVVLDIDQRFFSRNADSLDDHFKLAKLKNGYK